MIIGYKSSDIFQASEHLLVVPLPIDDTSINDGFARQVFNRFPHVEQRFKRLGGLATAGVDIVKPIHDDGGELVNYSLALCAVHERQAQGWEHAPQNLKTSLDIIAATSPLGRLSQLATAGVPGTGFSGLLGSSNHDKMRAVLDDHELLYL